MLPLQLAEPGRSYQIQKVSGSDAVKRHLEELGFVTGDDIVLVNLNDGGAIVNVKNVRVALDNDLVRRIMV